MRLPRTRRISGSAFLAAGMVAVAGALAWFGTGQSPSDLHWPAGDTAQLTLPGEPPSPDSEEVVYNTVSTGGLPTRIVIPGAEVDTPVVEVGVVLDGGEPRWETAWHAAGHHMDSSLPGQPGNMVISGHVSVVNPAAVAVFKHLDRLAEGDVIDVYSGDALYRYTVSRILIAAPDETKLLRSTAGSMVTLITCTKDLKDRLVVIGTLTEVVVPELDA